MRGSPIQIGYPWRQAVRLTAPIFPADASLLAEVRRTPDHDEVLATLTTANGGIERVSDSEVRLTITDTSQFQPGSVVTAIVRDDIDHPEHLLGLRVKVVRPATRRPP